MSESLLIPAEPFGPGWRNTPTSKTHKKEFDISCILNTQLSNHGMRSRRVEGDQYSPYDIEVMEYDFNTLQWGRLICRIDLENKPYERQGYFPAHGFPKHWFCVSFLARKNEKNVNTSRDVYLLFDDKPRPRVRWIHYSSLRQFGQLKDLGGKNRFYRIHPEHYNLIHSTFRSLVGWCVAIQNSEVPA